MDSLCLKIIELLKENAYMTSGEIGEAFSVSDRTIRNRITEINETMIRSGAVINSARGKGYHLEVIDDELFSQWLQSLYQENAAVPSSSAERVSYIMEYLLSTHEYTYIDDLCDLLYVTRNTLSADLKKAEQELTKFSLAIERRPNYGIRIKGKEADKRFCIISRIRNRDRYFMDMVKKGTEADELRRKMPPICHEYRYRLDADNYVNLRYAICAACKRASAGFSLSYEKKERENLEKNLHPKFLSMTERILNDLGEQFSVLNTEDEKLYISTQLAGRGNFDSIPDTEAAANTEEIVQIMLEAVKKGLRIDFMQDRELIRTLRHHMTAFDIRVRYRIPLENPSLDVLKKEYSLAYAIAYYACGALNRYYESTISEEEIGYIAIIFQMALEDRNRAAGKKNVVIVYAAGRSASRFFIRRFKEIFRDYLDQVYHCSAREIERFDFAGKKIDYCFTTLNHQFSLPVPCCQISMFPTEEEIRNYRSLFASASVNDLLKYYRQDLFIPHLSAADSTEALQQMTEKIRKYCDIPDDFLVFAAERKAAGLPDSTGPVAVLSGETLSPDDNIVCIALLDQPVIWKSREVQIILLVSLSDSDSSDTGLFVDVTGNLIGDREAVRDLLANRTFENLMRLLTAHRGN
ncbi:MAG: transcription antiterminator [Erysipelotrichaceae bacterium]|nr:transcription antiterminator [Erysipelotrichaceae bacterium]